MKPSTRETVYDLKMIEKLQTKFDSVFELSPDGQTFTSPGLMKGVPVERIQEDGPYYDDTWASLDIWQHKMNAAQTEGDTFKNGQRSPEDIQSQEGEKDDPKDSPKTAKLPPPAARRVMEWFGPGTPIHPNQLVSKRAMASDGLCNSWAILGAARIMGGLKPL